MHTDTYGRDIKEAYRIIENPSFERRLKAFDPRLKLMFEQKSKRWVIMEAAYDNSGWNVILKAENKDGSEKPLGEWVFNALFVKRRNWEVKAAQGATRWIDDLKYQAEKQKQIITKNISQEHQEMLREDVLQWRKASKELQGLPIADATAGYRKV